MEENFDALEVIARTRGKVKMDDVPTGDRLFLIWGWPTVAFFGLMFVLWHMLRQDWCLFVWAGIPLVGIPLMVRELRKDRQRRHMRTISSKTILDYWIFAGAVCFFRRLCLRLYGSDIRLLLSAHRGADRHRRLHHRRTGALPAYDHRRSGWSGRRDRRLLLAGTVKRLADSMRSRCGFALARYSGIALQPAS